MFRLPRAGELIHNVTVQKLTVTRNDAGTVSREWKAETPDPVRCKVDRLHGEELVYAQALAANARIRITMYPFRNLEPKNYRLWFKNRVLDILAVDDHQERGVMMVVLCGEAV